MAVILNVMTDEIVFYLSLDNSTYSCSENSICQYVLRSEIRNELILEEPLQCQGKYGASVCGVRREQH